MRKQSFTAVYQKRGAQYIAWVEEIPGVNTQGTTKGEVRENLKEALTLILEANQELAAARTKGAVTREPLEVFMPSMPAHV